MVAMNTSGLISEKNGRIFGNNLDEHYKYWLNSIFEQQDIIDLPPLSPRLVILQRNILSSKVSFAALAAREFYESLGLFYHVLLIAASTG
jgi:hypothetical protein